MHACGHVHILTYMPFTYMPSCLNTYIPPYLHPTYLQAQTYIYIYINPCVRAFLHACVRTHTHIVDTHAAFSLPNPRVRRWPMFGSMIQMSAAAGNRLIILFRKVPRRPAKSFVFDNCACDTAHFFACIAGLRWSRNDATRQTTRKGFAFCIVSVHRH